MICPVKFLGIRLRTNSWQSLLMPSFLSPLVHLQLDAIIVHIFSNFKTLFPISTYWWGGAHPSLIFQRTTLHRGHLYLSMVLTCGLYKILSCVYGLYNLGPGFKLGSIYKQIIITLKFFYQKEKDIDPSWKKTLFLCQLGCR